MEIEGVNIHWLGHDSFKIIAGKTIYIDPFQLKSGGKADIILITHDHQDHCSIEDIKKVATEESLIFCPPDCQSKLGGVPYRNVTTLEPGNKVKVGDIIIEAVPAYNTNKFRSPGTPFHPKENGWLGYIVVANGKRVYHAGDTDLIPEMKSIKADIALLPISGTYVMTAEEAAKAADLIHPTVVIPMHYGAIIGSASDVERLKAHTKVAVRVLPKE